MKILFPEQNETKKMGSDSVRTYANDYATCSSVALSDTLNLNLLSLKLIIIIATAYL